MKYEFCPINKYVTLSCREVWPERNEFGTADISPEEEFMAMREIFMADLPSKWRWNIMALYWKYVHVKMHLLFYILMEVNNILCVCGPLYKKQSEAKHLLRKGVVLAQ